ncbi:hypothetical protein [Borrelia hispanica]|uniref:hypothetical protein n=1 Tax=Borrelia hispanica TaxID=40835 RepID=UPI000467985E|nr:hypothetical protein [Borrelia hispanica]
MTELNENYYFKELDDLENDIKKPMFYKWLSKEQIKEKVACDKYHKIIKWDAFLNANPTILINEVNSIATVGFRSQTIKFNYLRLQYRFRHLKPSIEISTDPTLDTNDYILSFREAYKLANNEIIKLIDYFILTGTLSIQKDGKNQVVLPSNMYGLLNMPNQIKEEVEQSNKDKMDKIFEKIKSGLAKLEFGDEFSTPIMVLVDPLTSLKLSEPYVVKNLSFSYLWEDILIKIIKSINNRQRVYLQTSNLLQNQILIYPLNPNLIEFRPNKYMLPTLNEHVDKNSSDIAYSYLDFVLGGLLATEKTILRVDIKQS